MPAASINETSGLSTAGALPSPDSAGLDRSTQVGASEVTVQAGQLTAGEDAEASWSIVVKDHRGRRVFEIKTDSEFADDVVLDLGAFIIAGQVLASGAAQRVSPSPESAAEIAYQAASRLLELQRSRREERHAQA